MKSQEGTEKIGQISSEIKGYLPDHHRTIIRDIIYSLIPAGSISGAPKQKIIKLIKAIEKEPRDYYTEITGYFNEDNSDSCGLGRKFY